MKSTPTHSKWFQVWWREEANYPAWMTSTLHPNRHSAQYAAEVIQEGWAFADVRIVEATYDPIHQRFVSEPPL